MFYEDCGRCDGSGEMTFSELDPEEVEVLDDAREYDYDDKVICPECDGEKEVWLRWEEPTWQMEGFDSQEDWEDNVF